MEQIKNKDNPEEIGKTKKIEINNISKKFGSIQALERVSLSLEKGKIYGLLGRNGAGKSTLLNILTNRIRATSGSFTIDGEFSAKDGAMAKTYMVGPDNLFPKKKLKNILKDTAIFYPNFDFDGAMKDMEKFGLSPKAKFDKLSTGNNSIFKSIVALRSGADYIFLDEPTLGHDAVNRQMFYESVLSLFAEKKPCIVLSSHLISELAPLIEEVIFIKEGRLLLIEEAEKLRDEYRIISGPKQALERIIADNKLELIIKKDQALMSEGLIKLTNMSLESLVEILRDEKDISYRPAELQELFIALTQKSQNNEQERL